MELIYHSEFLNDLYWVASCVKDFEDEEKEIDG
jgi:hypothetical protein